MFAKAPVVRNRSRKILPESNLICQKIDSLFLSLSVLAQLFECPRRRPNIGFRLQLFLRIVHCACACAISTLRMTRIRTIGYSRNTFGATLDMNRYRAQSLLVFASTTLRPSLSHEQLWSTTAHASEQFR